MDMKLCYRPNLSKISHPNQILVLVFHQEQNEQRHFPLCIGQNVEKKKKITLPFLVPLKDETINDNWRFLNSTTTHKGEYAKAVDQGSIFTVVRKYPSTDCQFKNLNDCYNLLHFLLN